MRISDWSSDVCSSDLQNVWMGVSTPGAADLAVRHEIGIDRFMWGSDYPHDEGSHPYTREHLRSRLSGIAPAEVRKILSENAAQLYGFDLEALAPLAAQVGPAVAELRSEEHTSELQSLMRISYAVFCLKKKKINVTTDVTKSDK